MKKLIYILLFVVSPLISQTTYHVSETGTGDTLNTVSEVNALTLEAGDSILFKCDDTWRATLEINQGGADGSPVYIGYYGTGARPKILGSEEASGWVLVATNIWACYGFSDPYDGADSNPSFEFTDSTVWGWNKSVYTTGFANLDEEFEWTWHNDSVFGYAESDPDIRYVNIEIPERYYNISIASNGVNYLVIDSLELMYSRSMGIRDPYQTADSIGNTDLTIKNCEIAYIGYRYSGTGYGILSKYSNLIIKGCEIYECGRRMITIDIPASPDNTLNNSNILIENNIMHDGYHSTGVGINRGVKGRTDSLVIRNNLFYERVGKDFSRECYSSIAGLYAENNEYGATGESIISKVYMYNNIHHNLVGGALYLQGMEDVYYCNNTFTGGAPVNDTDFHELMIMVHSYVSNVHIWNNILCQKVSWSINPGAAIIYFNANVEDTYADFDASDMDYNLQWQGSDNMNSWTQNYQTRKFSNYDVWTGETGFEANSPEPEDPYFKDLANFDFSVADSSNAIGAAKSLWFVTDDYLGNPRSATAPSIGAIEYGGVDSTATDIKTFTIPSQTSSTVNATAHTVAIVMPYGTVVTSLTPTITLSTGATVAPTSGTATNFTSSVNYTVTALNTTTTQVWVVTVTVAAAPTPTTTKPAFKNGRIYIHNGKYYTRQY